MHVFSLFQAIHEELTETQWLDPVESLAWADGALVSLQGFLTSLTSKTSLVNQLQKTHAGRQVLLQNGMDMLTMKIIFMS